MADLPPYLYKPLQSETSIRIMILLPAKDEKDPLECRLENADIGDPRPYYGVSYVWGDESHPSRIQCEGAHISITRNADIALRHIRRATKDVPLWIDSISINQKDVDERNAQVRIMGDIYRKSKMVFIWLGSADEFESTAAALEGINILISNVWPLLEEWDKWTLHGLLDDSGTVVSDDISTHFNIPRHDSPQLEALRDLITKRPWFGRAWTFQENFLAKIGVFLCGRYYFSPWDLARACHFLQKLFWCSGQRNAAAQISAIVTTVGLHRDLVEGGLQKFITLEELLALRRGVGCKVPSDQVYSLLGVASDSVSIDPNYRKPFQTVFAETVVEIIRNTGKLRVFSHPDPGSSELPSWLPDWRRPRIKEHARITLPLSQELYSAAGSSVAKPKLSEDCKQLTIPGLAFDRIVSMQGASSYKASEHSWIVQKPTHNWSLGDEYKFTSESMNAAVHRTLDADLQSSSIHANPFQRQTPEYLASGQSALFTEPDSYLYYAPVLVLMALHVDLFLTRGRRIGRAPMNAKIGDIVAVLLGGNVPFILRPIGNNQYTFIGECYVHGFMDGEAFIDARRKADSEYDGSDTSWLQRLHEIPIPFPTQEFTLV